MDRITYFMENMFLDNYNNTNKRTDLTRDDWHLKLHINAKLKLKIKVYYGSVRE